MRRILALALAAMLSLSLAACGSNEVKNAPGKDSSGSTESGAAAPTTVSARDELLFGAQRDADTLDPQDQNDTYSEEICKMVYNTLVTFDETTTPSPSLAERWEVSEDNLTWTFYLRQDVKFHNGKAFTSKDVAATFNRALPQDSGFIAATMLKPIESVTAVDDYTVQIKTTEPYGPMLSLLCNYNTAIVDSDYADQYGKGKMGITPETVNGTGPYKLVEWSKDEEMVIEKFDDYFGQKGIIKTIRYLPIPEAAARTIALETGEVDVIMKVPAEDVKRFESEGVFSVTKQTGVGQRLFRFGCDDEIMANTKVRQALVYAVDRDAIRKALFDGIADESVGPLAPIIFGSHNFGAIKPDLDKAKSLLAEAGYPNGFTTKIVTTTQYDKGVQMAEMIAADFAKIGVTAEIEVLEWSVLLPTWQGITAEEFDEPLFVMGAGTSMVDADGGFRGLYTTTPDGKNDRNYGFYSNAEVDRLVQAAMTETDQEVRKDLYKQAGQILYLDDPVGIWLFDSYNVIATSPELTGARIDALGCILFDQASFTA